MTRIAACSRKAPWNEVGPGGRAANASWFDGARLGSCETVDLDGLKAVNDTRGHEAGDRLLANIGQRLADALRGADLIARIGPVAVPDDATEPSILVRQADEAMYRVKSRGKNALRHVPSHRATRTATRSATVHGMRWTLLVAALAAACSPKPAARPTTVATAPPAPAPAPKPVPPPAPAPAVTPPAPDAAFSAYAETVSQAWLDAHPDGAADLGYHTYDGKLPSYTPQAIAARVAALHEEETRLAAFTGLATEHEVERQTLLSQVRGDLFDLEVTRAPARDPIFYLDPVQLLGYISRDYAPVDDRARALIAACRAAPAYLDQAMANLEPALPRTWIATALLETHGAITFAKGDIAHALAGMSPDVASQLAPALAGYVAALNKYAAFLEHRKAKQTDAFALGADAFRQMLRDKEGVEVDLDHLRAIAEADLARNTAALTAAAHAIDPEKTVAQVVAEVNADRPRAAGELALAGKQLAELRAFITAHHIVTIPSDEVAQAEPTPPFMRWNFAFMNAPGPFERKALPSFYYISPPDPSWSRTQQLEYIPSREDLVFVTAHEVWPGHFLHHLHIERNPSKILRTFWTYSTGEGWAHYAEQMMWEQGLGDGDPKFHVGQLQEALLRDVRFVVALGLHTGHMTVAQARELFITKGYQDPVSAQQEAVRGTFDPQYLDYTLGKLMVLKLRDDWRAAHPAGTLEQFHDAFLSYGCAPIPAIRAALLGPGAGPAL